MRRWFLPGLALGVGLVIGACEDSSTSNQPQPSFDASTFDAPATDGPSVPDSAADAPLDAQGDAPADAAAGFSPKTNCDAPLPLTAYTGNDYAGRVALASAPGAPVTLLFNKVVIGLPLGDCELRTFGVAAPNAWGGAATLTGACTAIMPWHISAGGTAAVALWHTASANQRRRVTSASSADVGSAGVDNAPDVSAVKMGPAGHALQLYRSGTGVAVLLIDPAGSVTTLPENTLAAGVDGTTAALDATGSGYAVWTLSGAIQARRFTAGAWATPVASNVTTDVASGKIDATILPNGDAYVVYGISNGSQGLRGIRISSAAGLTTFGATDDLASGKGITKLVSLAATDGETTVVYGESDGNGNVTTSARRGGPAAFGAAMPLGTDPGEYLSASIDGAGHVTVLRNTGSLFHHRIAHLGTTWTAAKRIDAAAGTGSVANYTAVAHLPNGDPIAVWLDGHDLKYTVCR